MTAENSGKRQKGKPRGRPIQPGQVLNPGGRPSGYAAFRESFRAQTDLDTIQRRLREIMASGDDKDATSAMRLWMEYGWGKPSSSPEDLEATTASPFAGLTAEQLLEIARAKK